MAETKFITLAAGVLDEEEGTYYSLPATFPSEKAAVAHFASLKESGKHDAGVLIRKTGETWKKLSEFGGDVFIARDPWGGFDLVHAQTLGM